jgi:hypothetical protein
MHTTQEECSSHNDCSWINKECTPKCEMFSKTKCDRYNTCVWNPQSDKCKTASKSCGKINTTNECNSYTDCSWNNEECLPRCDMFDKSKCDSYHDCLWNTQREKCAFKDI